MYEHLAAYGQHVTPPRRLAEAQGTDGWPRAGVYLVYEPGEYREDGTTPRIVRVGTHALTATSKTTLWGRLRTHRGNIHGKNAGAGNHRASVFRRHVGTALIKCGSFSEAADSWGSTRASPETRERERALETAVSDHIGSMHVLGVAVADRPSRGAFERAAIDLLSNFDRAAVDPPSQSWLGHQAAHLAVRRSGLWNVNHVAMEPVESDLDVVWQHLAGR